MTVSYEKMLKKYGSPLYAYDCNTLVKKAAELKKFEQKLQKDIGAEVKLHYSTKSNGNPHILKIIKDMGISVDAMSPTELELDKAAGFKNEDILYVCNNISPIEMAEIVDQGILICLDSISQIELLGQIRPGSDVMVRINPGSFRIGHSDSVVTAGENTKFGVSEANIPELLKTADKYNLNIVGIHQHLGSSFLDEEIDVFVSGVKAGLDIAKKYFKDLSIVDLGGGFGVPYKDTELPLNFDLLEEKLTPILKDFINSYHKVKFKFEPGRYIPCEAGFILGTVHAVKNEYGKTWIGTDIGMNILARPKLYGSYHKIEIIPLEEEDVTEFIKDANIVGNICESGDKLGEGRTVIDPKIGDIVKVYNAGAYGYCMAYPYTGRLRPAEVMIQPDGTTKLIRKREKVSDVLSLIPGI